MGSAARDTARFRSSGPLVSTAGWRSWVVSYETNLTLADSVALAAQADSVFQHVRETVVPQTDSTALMEAHFKTDFMGRGGGMRFLYHRAPDGTWSRSQ